MGSDAPDWDTQPGADLGVRHWRVFEQQADQPLVARGQGQERLAQGRVALGHEQLLLGRPGLLGREDLGVQPVPGREWFPGGAQDPEALSPGCGGQPAG